MSLHVLAAEYALGMIPTDDLPSIATDLLVKGTVPEAVSCRMCRPPAPATAALGSAVTATLGASISKLA